MPIASFMTSVSVPGPMVLTHRCDLSKSDHKGEWRVLHDIEAGPARDVELRVSGLVDSMGATFIVQLWKILQAKGRKLIVAYRDEKTLRILEILGFHRILTVVQKDF